MAEPTSQDPDGMLSAAASPPPGVVCRADGAGLVVVVLSGAWTRAVPRPALEGVLAALRQAGPRRVGFCDAGVTAWDSTLLALLLGVHRAVLGMGLEVDTSGLRPGLQTLVRLATAVPERAPRAEAPAVGGLVARLGHAAIAHGAAALDLVDFVGACCLGLLRAARGQARYRRVDLMVLLHACGPSALGIVALIGFLMGLILAFVGAVQLRLFGAEIYVADLVGIGIVREMGAIMAGVVMAGRSGAAFAAQIGTMQVNDEVDALRTMGLDPVEFLVVPRLLAMTLTMLVLCLFADVMGVLGGGLVGVGLMGINLTQYWNETVKAVGLNDLAVGLFMSLVFGVLVALAGCRRGLQCGRSSADVGQAATSAVVTGIVWIVVATAVITVLCDAIGI